VEELLGHYAEELRATSQPDGALRILDIASEPEQHFIMSIPQREQTDPSVSTE
jgi:glutamate synthase (NADPH) large chain